MLPRVSYFTVVGRKLPQCPIEVSHRNIVPVRSISTKTEHTPARTDMRLFFPTPTRQTKARVYRVADIVHCLTGVELRRQSVPRSLATGLTLATLSSDLWL